MTTSTYRRCSKAVGMRKLYWRGFSIKTRSLLSFESPVTVSSRHFVSFNRDKVQGEFGAYAKQYDESIQSPETFWKEAASSLHWFEEPQTVLQRNKNNSHFHDWFPDGKINTSFNCLDVHVNDGRGDQNALIYDSPMTGKKEEYTYKELLEKVSLFGGALQNDLGVQPGDRVVIYMPLIPQAAIAMLACARIGAVHSVVFGGFASHELSNRIDHSTPKVIITASCGIEPSRIVPYRPILDDALRFSKHEVESVVVIQRRDVEECELGPLDADYDELMKDATPVQALPLPSTHPHYILYTSGTTGLPKGVLRDTGGHATALKYSMNAFYSTRPGDVFWAASDIGWVVGHSYLIYGPLLHGCTTIMYEGKPIGTPDQGSFWRIVEEYKVKTMFTAPTAFRAIKQADPHSEFAKKYNLESLENLFLAGEHSDPETIRWLERTLPHIPSPIDHWWQTELGWPAVGNAAGLGRVPIRYGSCSMPVTGFEVSIFDDEGNAMAPNELGNMVIKTPLPPGSLKTLYKDDKRFIEKYLEKYPGYYDCGDAAFIDEDGYISIMGRTDDIINVAGHRLSTGAMEEVLLEHPSVADCAVIPVRDEIKGQLPFGFVVCSKDTGPVDHKKICDDLVKMVREKLGPVAAFKNVTVIECGLPKTRSGKVRYILRRLVLYDPKDLI
mmetsp:Transcript_16020/g.34716  ORF Transcript_16020/g.34716 Transcript_16020/m.34716 type:complete len:669 (-) Transcript_16020:549-2555(-)